MAPVNRLGLVKTREAARRLATFDRTIPLAVVPGGVADDLMIISD